MFFSLRVLLFLLGAFGVGLASTASAQAPALTSRAYAGQGVGHGSRSAPSLPVLDRRSGRGYDLGYGRGYRRTPHRIWVSPSWTTVRERVWVPGDQRQIWVPAQYEVLYDACGNLHQRLVREGYWRVIGSPGRFEWRDVPRQIPGYWKVVG